MTDDRVTMNRSVDRWMDRRTDRTLRGKEGGREDGGEKSHKSGRSVGRSVGESNEKKVAINNVPSLSPPLASHWRPGAIQDSRSGQEAVTQFSWA